MAWNQGQIGPRGLIRFRTALLPIAQRTQRDMVARGEFLLRQFQSPADDFRLRRPLHPFEIVRGQWLCVTIRPRSTLNGLGSHGSRRFAESSLLAHTALPCVPK